MSDFSQCNVEKLYRGPFYGPKEPFLSEGDGFSIQRLFQAATTNDIIVNIIIAGYLDCIYTRGFPFIFFLIKKRSKKIKLKIGNCCAPFTIGFTCVVPAHRTSNPSFVIADFQRTIQTLIYRHGTTIEIYTLRSKKCHLHFNEIFSKCSN